MSEKPPQFDRQFDTASQDKEARRDSSGLRGILEFLGILVISFALVFGIVRPFLVEAFYIPSESMVPTLMVGDRVLVNKFIYRFEDPKKGQIAVFKSVEGGRALPGGPIEHLNALLHGKRDTREDLIKRVVAVPGDTVAVKNGQLFVNGKRQNDSFVNKTNFMAQPPYGPKKVPPNHYFFMGDNRANSRDSRYFGAVPKKNIEGEAFLRFWPLDRLGLL